VKEEAGRITPVRESRERDGMGPYLTMRQITGHEGSTLNNAIEILTSERDANGGSYKYSLEWMDPHGDYQSSQGITFQNGPLESGYNGITDEALIVVLIDRLEGFDTGPFRCRENFLAKTKLEEALHWLQHRTRLRQKRGVEGTHTV
jgi:hypothetical protein